MTSRVSKYQHVGCSDPWEKLKGVDPPGRALDYWFSRKIVGFLDGIESGLGLVRKGQLRCITSVIFQLRMKWLAWVFIYLFYFLLLLSSFYESCEAWYLTRNGKNLNRNKTYQLFASYRKQSVCHHGVHLSALFSWISRRYAEKCTVWTFGMAFALVLLYEFV